MTTLTDRMAAHGLAPGVPWEDLIGRVDLSNTSLADLIDEGIDITGDDALADIRRAAGYTA